MTPADVLAGRAAWAVVQGDSAAVLASLADCSIDAVVTDPPSGIGFMGKDWDSNKGGRDQWIEWLAGIMRECLRVLKPGGHALVWALPRTSHWTGTALELAGFEVRDVVSHWFGSGFPKSLDVAKVIDKTAGHWRGKAGPAVSSNGSMSAPNYQRTDKGGPITAAAAAAGWGTALKPACEFWWLARKPLDGTVGGNFQRHGTGALNVDGCRVAGDPVPARPATHTGEHEAWQRPWKSDSAAVAARQERKDESAAKATALGRWPAHLVLSHGAGCGDGCAPGCPVAELDRQSGDMHGAGFAQPKQEKWANQSNAVYGKGVGSGPNGARFGDTGTASRFFATFAADPGFFYTPKPATSEKSAGLETLPRRRGEEITGRKEGSAGSLNPRAGAGARNGARNTHPTVKPIALMRWLCRLITPPGGVVLDPFAGSGTTLVAALRENFRAIGIEREPEYMEILKLRVSEDAPLFNRQAAP